MIHRRRTLGYNIQWQLLDAATKVRDVSVKRLEAVQRVRDAHTDLVIRAMRYCAIRGMVTSLAAHSIHGTIKLPKIEARAFLPKKNLEQT
jgi:hypothetical protein